MATFVADSLRDIRRLCDHARVNLELSNDVYISGKAFFLTSDRFKVFDLFWIYTNITLPSCTISQHVNKLINMHFVIVDRSYSSNWLKNRRWGERRWDYIRKEMFKGSSCTFNRRQFMSAALLFRGDNFPPPWSVFLFQSVGTPRSLVIEGFL